MPKFRSALRVSGFYSVMKNALITTSRTPVIPIVAPPMPTGGGRTIDYQNSDDERSPRPHALLQALRLHFEDLAELAKQVTDWRTVTARGRTKAQTSTLPVRFPRKNRTTRRHR